MTLYRVDLYKLKNDEQYHTVLEEKERMAAFGKAMGMSGFVGDAVMYFVEEIE